MKKRSLSAIVLLIVLVGAMRRINGQEYIYLGKCEKTSNGKTKDAILADAFEAVIGAIYLDAGYDITKQIVLRLLDREINLTLKGTNFNTDYKTSLQEKLQKNGTVKIEYILILFNGIKFIKKI